MIKKVAKIPPSKETPIPVSDIQEEILYCNYCNIQLLRNGNDKQCPKCGIKYNPSQNIRHGTTVETMDGEIMIGEPIGIEATPGVAFPPDVNINRKKPELKSGFAALASKGTIKFLNYSETIPR